MKKLVLLGGPPGVGKTSTMDELAGLIPRSGLLDADHVWRISPDLEFPGSRATAHANVNSVLHGYLDAGADTVILNWVFARDVLFQPVIDSLADRVDVVLQIYLVAEPGVLEARLRERNERRPIEAFEEFVQYALGRLEMIHALGYPVIDTTHLSPAEAAVEVQAMVVA